jgi:hypothetical protein
MFNVLRQSADADADSMARIARQDKNASVGSLES